MRHTQLRITTVLHFQDKKMCKLARKGRGSKSWTDQLMNNCPSGGSCHIRLDILDTVDLQIKNLTQTCHPLLRGAHWLATGPNKVAISVTWNQAHPAYQVGSNQKPDSISHFKWDIMYSSGVPEALASWNMQVMTDYVSPLEIASNLIWE